MRNMFPLSTRVRFMKTMSFLVSTGIPFIEALHFAQEKESKQKISMHLRTVLKRIHAGSRISQAFDSSPYIVDASSLRLMEHGELTGTLSATCVRIADDLEGLLRQRTSLVVSLVYPGLILCLAIVLVIILLVFVFPKILAIISSSGVVLPFTTRALLNVSDFIRQYGVGLIIVSLIICGAIRYWARTSPLPTKYVNMMLLRIPYIKHLYVLSKGKRFASQVALFVGTGFSLSEALYYIELHEKDIVYKKACKRILDGVRGGKRMSTTLMHEVKLFPRDVIHFASMGEESGTLAQTLLQASRMIEYELSSIQRTMLALIEPLLMISLGGLVGGISFSLMGPMYQMTSSLSSMP